MNRRNFLGILSAVPFVGLILPKRANAFLNEVSVQKLDINDPNIQKLIPQHPMFGKITEYNVQYYDKCCIVKIHFENGTKAKYIGYFTGNIPYYHLLEKQFCSDTRNVPSEWTYCKNKVVVDNKELILMNLNIVQPLISGERINSLWQKNQN